MHRYMLLPFLVFSLIIAAIYSLSILREGGREPSGESEPGKPASVSSMDGVSVVNTRDGKRQWLLRSRRIEMTGSHASLDAVEAEVTGLGMSVKAPLGQYDMDSGELGLSGDVRMYGDDYVVSAPDILMDPGSGELRSSGNVLIDGKGFRITGSGLLAMGQEIRLLSDVKAVFY